MLILLRHSITLWLIFAGCYLTRDVEAQIWECSSIKTGRSVLTNNPDRHDVNNCKGHGFRLGSFNKIPETAFVNYSKTRISELKPNEKKNDSVRNIPSSSEEAIHSVNQAPGKIEIKFEAKDFSLKKSGKQKNRNKGSSQCQVKGIVKASETGRVKLRILRGALGVEDKKLTIKTPDTNQPFSYTLKGKCRDATIEASWA